MEVKFKPSNGYILIQLDLVEEKTEAGLIKSKAMIEDEKRTKGIFKKIAAISDTSKFKVGEMVLVPGGGHPGVTLEGMDYIVLNEALIMGKLI